MGLIAVCIVAGVTADAAVLYFVPPELVPPLDLPVGTVILPQQGFQVTFGVTQDSGRLVGSWYATEGGLISIYPAGNAPQGLQSLPCIAYVPWHGTASLTLGRGVYTMVVGLNGGNFTVTSVVTVLYPGNATPTDRGTMASWCGLFM